MYQNMSLLEDLKTIEIKPYTPVYSGRLTSFENTQRYNNDSNRSPQISSRLSKFHPLNFDEDSDEQSDEFDSKSNATTNLSLFTIDSKEKIPRIKYGEIGHFSPWERFTNRNAQKTIHQYAYLIKSILRHYKEFLEREIDEEEDFIEPNLVELLDQYEFTALYSGFYERVLNLKSNSISSFNEISKTEKTFKNMNPQFPKRLKTSRRYTLASTSELEKFLSENKSKKKKENNNNLEDFHSDSLHLLDISEPKLYVPDILKGAPILNISKNKTTKEISIEKSNKNKKYSKTESKLKSYIGSQIRTSKSAGSRTHGYLSKSAILVHKTGSSKNIKEKNADKDKNKELKICSDLLKTIEKDIKTNKGPIYFADLKDYNIDAWNKSKPYSLASKYLYVYEWLINLNPTGSDTIEYFNNEIITGSIPFSTATNVASDYIIETSSVSNSFSFNSQFEKRTPNIFLPKFIFNNKPLKTQEEKTRVGLNDDQVSDLVNQYQKKRAKTTLSLNAHSQRENNNSINSNSKSRRDSSWLQVQEVNQKLVLRDKLKKAQIQNDMLRASIKLDLFVL